MNSLSEMAEADPKCVAFDAVGTIIYCKPSVAAIYSNVAAVHGSSLSEKEVGRQLRSAMSVFDEHDARTDCATTEEQEYELWREVVSRVIDDVGDFDAFFNELHDRFANPDVWGVFDDVASTFDALKQLGIEVAIASNFDRRLHGVCDAYPELAGISNRVISSEVGFRKPSVRYYNALAGACGCEPNEILMVGDTPSNDVDGALAAGLKAVLIDRTCDADLPHRINSLNQVIELVSA